MIPENIGNYENLTDGFGASQPAFEYRWCVFFVYSTLYFRVFLHFGRRQRNVPSKKAVLVTRRWVQLDKKRRGRTSLFVAHSQNRSREEIVQNPAGVLQAPAFDRAVEALEISFLVHTLVPTA